MVNATLPSAGHRSESFTAHDGQRLVGTLVVQFPLRDNPHVAAIDIWVDPPARRAGVGRRLYACAAERARAASRTLVIGEVRRGSAGEAFVAAVGGECRLPSARRMLSLDGLDRDRLARLRAEALRHAAGYSLVGWTGMAPEQHVDGAAAVLASMNDAPIDDLDVQDEVWDAGRLREMDRRSLEAGGYRPSGASTRSCRPAGARPWWRRPIAGIGSACCSRWR